MLSLKFFIPICGFLIFAAGQESNDPYLLTNQCLSTKINVPRNISMEFCGDWICQNDVRMGITIPVCTLLGGPREFVNCIRYTEKEACDKFSCLIRTPYLHIENCISVTKKGLAAVKANTCTPSCPYCQACLPPLPDWWDLCGPREMCECPAPCSPCWEQDCDCSRSICPSCENCPPCPE